MRNKLKLAAILAVLAGPTLADPALGVWKTGEDGGLYGHVQLYKCDSKICGRIVRQFDATTDAEVTSANIGKRILWDFDPQGDGAYEDGKTLRIANNRTYRSRLRMRGPNEIRAAGCIGPICIPQTWQRVN